MRLNTGSVTVENVSFQGFIADGRGGAKKGSVIAASGDSEVHLEGSVVFIGNTAVYGAAIDLYNGAALVIETNSSVQFTDNFAIGGDSSNNGGAINAEESSIDMLVGAKVTFHGNYANRWGNGGALYLKDAPMSVAYGTTLLFDGNTALDSGGAIYAEGGASTIVCGGIMSFIDNSGGQWGGGAVRLMSGSAMELGATSVVNFTHNTCADGSGGAFFLNDDAGSLSALPGAHVTFYDNMAGSRGGAIYLHSNIIILAASVLIFEGNLASQGGAIYGSGGAGMTLGGGVSSDPAPIVSFVENKASSSGDLDDRGGAIAIFDEGCFITFGGVDAQVLFQENVANGGHGGAISHRTAWVKGVLIKAEGGANVTFADNYCSGGACRGGAFYSHGGFDIKAEDGSTYTFFRNKAYTGRCGAISAQGTFDLVGDFLFLENEAESAGAICNTGDTLFYGTFQFIRNLALLYDGGALSLSEGFFDFRTAISVLFDGNSAKRNGGTIYIYAYATLYLDNFIIRNSGRHLMCSDNDQDSDGDSYGDSCSPWYNTYPDTCGEHDDDDFIATDMCCACGGGVEKISVAGIGTIYIGQASRQDSVVIRNGAFIDNTARYGGAALYITSSERIFISNVTFENNVVDAAVEDDYASAFGGAVFFHQDCKFIAFGGCTFTGNGLVLPDTSLMDQSYGANFHGGAILLNSVISNVALVGLDTFSGIVAKQSTHPIAQENRCLNNNDEQYVEVILDNHYVQGAESIFVSFDMPFELNQGNSLKVTGDNGFVWEATSNSIVPGMNAPMLQVPGTHVSIVLKGVPPGFCEQAGAYGVDVWVIPYLNDVAAKTTPTQFMNNFSPNSGGAVSLYSNIKSLFIDSVLFAGNEALQSGGALLVEMGHTELHVLRSRFVNNSATDGGAITIGSVIAGLTLADSEFIGNAATRGGGLLIRSSTGKGAGLSGLEDSVSYLTRLTFARNTASDSGGGMSVLLDNLVKMTEIEFRDNSAATYGGGLYIGGENTIELTNALFVGNYATGASSCGGGLAGMDANVLSLGDQVFEENRASCGGGACLRDRSSVKWSGSSVFRGNVAESLGGALHLLRSYYPVFAPNAGLVIDGNQAEYGSAMAVIELMTDATTAAYNSQSNPSSSLEFRNMTMDGNVARSGGTFFWVCVNASQASGLRIDASVVFGPSNTAQYGAVVATQPVRLVPFTSNYSVTVYGDHLDPPPEYILQDFYGQHVLSDNTSVVSVTIDASRCGSRFGGGLFKGEVGAYTHNGVGTLTGLIASCEPQGSMTVSATAHLRMNVKESDMDLTTDFDTLFPVATTTFTFRSCWDGETSETLDCVECPVGSFSLTYETGASCIKCNSILGVSECHANAITLATGYWRRLPTNAAVLLCPLGDVACVGGYGTGDQLCADGYTGPLCSVCAAQYYFQEGICNSCDNALTATSIVALAVVVILVMAVGYMAFKKFVVESESLEIEEKMADKRISRGSVRLDPDGDDVVGAGGGVGDRLSPRRASLATGIAKRRASLVAALAVKEDANNRLESRESVMEVHDTTLGWVETLGTVLVAAQATGLTTRLKIVMATMQIVVSAKVNLNVHMPASFEDFCGYFDFFNLSVLGLVPIGCQRRISYPEKMFLTTLLPLLFLGLLYSLYKFELCQNHTPTSASDQELGPSDDADGDIENAPATSSRSGGDTVNMRTHPSPTAAQLQRERHDIRQTQITQRYMFVFLFASYSVLPSVTTSIFNTFPCTNIDPNGEDSDVAGDYFMRSDLNMSCDAHAYHMAVAWAVAMIFVYPIGLPCLYWYILLREKDAIISREMDEDDGKSENDENKQAGATTNGDSTAASGHGDGGDVEMSEISHVSYVSDNPLHSTRGGAQKVGVEHALKMLEPVPVLDETPGGGDHVTNNTDNKASRLGTLSFLFAAYAPQYWYWEVVETYRRLFMTAVISVVDPGTSVQAVFAILLALFSIKLYSVHVPYSEGTDGILAEAGQFQVFFTFFGGLIIQADLLGSDYNDTVGGVLIAVNMGVFALGGWYQWAATRDVLVRSRAILLGGADPL
jgi:predicted outer membrane repeat protein